MASSRIKGITVEIGGDTTGLQSALKEVNSSIKTTQSSLKDVNKLLKLDPTNTELLSQKQKLLKEAIGETTTKLESLKSAQEQAKQQLENGDLGQDKYDALQREIIETEQELKKLQEQAIDSNEALCKIEAAGEALESVGNSISSVGQKMLTVTAGVTALGTAAVSTTATFDSSLSQVQATLGITSDAMSDLNGESVNTMDALRSLAKEMGSSTAFSASECADAMNYLALAGYDTQQIYDTLPTVLNLAAAGSIDLATASDMVTDAMSALGMETSEADTMVDQMAKTSSKTNTSVAQLGEAILSIGATAKSIKGGTAELNTALGILANNGIKGAEGGTHLRNVILALQSPTNTAAACIEQLGLEVYDSEGNMRSLNDILSDLNSSMDSMTSAEKNDIISTIFNKTDIASVNALLANTGETWDSLQESITESGGAAQQMADTQLDNLSGQITILKSALEGLSISFGEVLMPAIRSAVEKVQAFVDKLNSMSDAQRETIIKIAAFVAALGPLLIILGKTISTVGSAMKGFSSMTKAVAKLGVKIAGSSGSITGLGSALSAVAAPVLAVVAVIAVLVAAFKHLWDTNEEFRNTVTAIWDGIKSKFEAFASGITERLNALGFDFESIVDALKAVWDGFCNLLAPVFEAAFSVISTVLGTVLDVITGLLDVFIGLFTGNWSQLWTGIKEIFSGIWDGITGILSAALNLLKGIANTVLGWFGTSWEAVWDAIKEKVSSAISVVSSVISSVMAVIASVISTVWTAISTKVSTTVNAIKTTITTVFNAIKSVATTVWNGVKTAISTVVDGIKSKVSSVFESVKSTVSSVFNSIKSTASSVWNAIKSTITEPIEAAKNTVKSALDKISSYFSGLKLSFPSIKLPHFSISGSFSLSPPSVPSLSVQWYKDGGIMTSPTLFGMNGSALMAGGEAGAEAILPLKGFYDQLESILTSRLNTDTMEQYLAVIAANSGKGIYLDDGTLVGRLLPAIDSGLGQSQKLNARLSL
jgi:TP901 family phage tail tape measure protein